MPASSGTAVLSTSLTSRVERCVIALLVALALSGCTRPADPPGPAARSDAADWVLATADVLDAHTRAPTALRPSLPPWAGLSRAWDVAGYVIGDGTAGDQTDGDVMLGVVLQRRGAPADFAVVLRDADDADDAPVEGFVPRRATPWIDGGTAPGSFLALYATLRFVPAEGVPTPRRLADALRARVGGAPITIAGHGLGAVLATYLGVDLATDAIDNPVAGRFFASPNPGDAAFARLVARVLPDRIAYANARDPMPTRSPGLGYDDYRPLEGALRVTTSSGLHVRATPACNHHPVTYAAMLDGARMSVVAWQQRLADSGMPRDCLRGGAPTLAWEAARPGARTGNPVR